MKESNKKRSQSMQEWHKNHDHPQLHSKRSKISRELQSETLKELPRLTCPHCGKSGLNAGMYARWHGDNCKKY